MSAQFRECLGPASQQHTIAQIDRGVPRLPVHVGGAAAIAARELEDMGYLRREPDPRDRRGVVFLLSDQGEALIRDSVAALDALDARYAKAIGPRRYSALQRGARALYESLGAPGAEGGRYRQLMSWGLPMDAG